ncbi:MAG: hypothetical protein Q8P23_01025 [bacterium]|nr:hypothetical protein [bacterium]
MNKECVLTAIELGSLIEQTYREALQIADLDRSSRAETNVFLKELKTDVTDHVRRIRAELVHVNTACGHYLDVEKLMHNVEGDLKAGIWISVAGRTDDIFGEIEKA